MKAVITAAGIGTRMLPATKEVPKEMLPVVIYKNGKASLRPTLQVIFESLYDVGIRDFCFVVNRFKRVIENHFSPDYEFIKFLQEKGKGDEAKDLIEFYNKVKNSTIVYVNQYEPFGFGHAVLITESFVGSDSFIVHAGDDYILSKDNNHLKKLLKTYEEYKANVVLLLEEIDDPRKYGVVSGNFVDEGIIEISNIVEKPKEPPSNLAIIAIYIFNSLIFEALRKVGFDPSGEIPLSIAIDYVAKKYGSVYGVKLDPGESRIDVGNPLTYIHGLFKLYKVYSNENLDRYPNT